MKKLLALTLTLVMAMSMSLNTFAAGPAAGNQTITDSTEGKKVDIQVNGKYTDYLKADTVVSVDVAWDAMEFTYAKDAQGVWNPASHEYKDVEASKGWTKDTASIKLTNHSNAKIEATFAFAKDAGLSDKTITGSFTGLTENKMELTTAVNTERENAPNGTTEFGISGDAIDTNATLGTITVTLAAVTE